MTKNILAAAAVLALLAGGAAYWRREARPAASAGAVKYQCPMHPQIVRDHPGDCPICHMKLEKVEGDLVQEPQKDMRPPAQEGAVPGHAAFSLSEGRRQLIGVKTTQAARLDIVKTLRLPGRMGEDGSTVLAQALEIDAGSLRPGLNATVKAADSRHLRARVAGVDRHLDSYSRTFGVALQLLEAAGAGMRPGVYCDVRVEVKAAQGLGIPKDAVLDTGERQLVFVMKDGGRFEPRAIQLGREGDTHVEVVKGLKEGERVVTSANFLIDSESRFKAAVEQY